LFIFDSGSGTRLKRLDHLLPPSAQDEDAALEKRLQGLAAFQQAALRHAFLSPSLCRLVYSTCSVHQQENEDVVAALLPLAREKGFRLVAPFPDWPRRGLPVLEGAERLVRVDEVEDGTDGFFIAVFERAGAEEDHKAVEAESKQQKKMKKKKKKTIVMSVQPDKAVFKA
jgi:putative methyltransferase